VTAVELTANRAAAAAAIAPRRRRCQIHSPLGPRSAGASARRCWFRTRRRGSLELPVIGVGGLYVLKKKKKFITRCPRNRRRRRRCFSPAETRRRRLALTCLLLLFVSHSV